MGAGIQVHDADGRLQFDSDNPGITLAESGTATLAAGSSENSVTITVSGTELNPPFFAFRVSGESRSGYSYRGSNTWEFGVSSSAPAGTQVEFWIFRYAKTIAPVSFGFEARDETGKIVWNTGCRPMRVVGIGGINPPSEPSGKRYARIPMTTFGVQFLVVDVTNYSLGGEVTPVPQETISLPSNQSRSDDAATFTFPAITASASGSASNINWTISGTGWSIASGQGTLTCQPRISTSATGTYNATLTVEAVVDGSLVSDSMMLTYTREAPDATVSVSISPTSETDSAASSSHTLDSIAVSVSNGTASSYTWSLGGGGSGGNWYVYSGQGTSSARARVTGVPNGVTARAVFTCSVVVNGQTYTRSCSLEFTNTSDPDPDIGGSISPPSDANATGTSADYIFGFATANVTGGTVSNYAWSIVSPNGGSWSIHSGQGTKTARARVDGAPIGTSTARLRCVATVNGESYTAETNLSYARSSSASLDIEPSFLARTGTISPYHFPRFELVFTGTVTALHDFEILYPSSGSSWDFAGGTTPTAAYPRVTVSGGSGTYNATLLGKIELDGEVYTASAFLEYRYTAS